MDPKQHQGLPEAPGSVRCPWCGADTGQRWLPFVVGYENKGSLRGQALRGIGREVEDLAMSYCEGCRRSALWHGKAPVWPRDTSAPSPAVGMPREALVEFEEARQVLDRSPRAAAALLRLSLQKLFEHLGRPDEAKNDDFDSPVRWSLPTADWQVLRAVRAGDDAGLPGRLDPSDDRETACALFELINLIVERLITEPEAWKPRSG